MKESVYGAIPSEWRIVRLKDICDVNPSLPNNIQLAPDTPVTFVPMAAVDEGVAEIARPEVKPFREVRKGYTSFIDGDVLFAKITPSMENGKAAIARGLINGVGFGSTEFHVLRPNMQLVLPEWLLALLRRKDFRSVAKSRFVGTAGQQRVPPDFLESFPIPLPPLPEQRRIVAILRKADELRRLRQRANQRARDLLPALFEQIKTRALKWATIESVTQRCNRTDPAQLPTSNFLYIDISSIDNQTGRITDFRRLATTDAPSRARQAVQKGDVLVSSVRPNLQNNAIIENEPNLPLIASTGFVVLRANGQQVTSGYLYLIVRTEWFSQQLVRKVQGAAYPAVTEHDVLSIKIPLPDHQLLLLVDEMVQKYLLINNQSQRFGERITQLRNSLLAHAFTGELTAAWRQAHAEEMRAAAAARDRLLAQRQKPEKISVEITGDFQAIAAAMHELTTAANKIVAGAIQPALSGFTRAAEALRPNLAPLAEEVNEQLQKAMASWDEEIKRQWVAAIPNWTDILRDKYSQEFADLAEKIAELARLQMEEPFSRREVEARVLAVAQSKKGHLTLSALATDWRLNHFPRQTIQEAVDMLVLRGQLRPVTLKVDTGDPARPYALLSAYALVREDEQIAADEIDL